MGLEKFRENAIVSVQTLLALGKYCLFGMGLLIALAVFYNYVVISLWSLYLKPVPPSLEVVTRENFSFEAYSGARPRLQEALNKLLPAGTPKEAVESLLVQKAKAEMTRNLKTQSIFKHEAKMLTKIGLYPCTPMWRIVVQYDEEQKLSALKLTGPCRF